MSSKPSNSTSSASKKPVQNRISIGDIFDEETIGSNGVGGLQDDNDYEKTLREFMEDDQGDWEGKVEGSDQQQDVRPFAIDSNQAQDEEEDEGFVYAGNSSMTSTNGKTEDQKGPRGEDEEEGEEEFFYGGIDRRKAILEDDEKDLGLNSGDYSLDLKDVMGSDEESNPDSQLEVEQQEELSNSSNSINPDDSDVTDSVLPENGKGKERQDHQARPSLPTSYSTASSLNSALNLPRRPLEYPTISRLRSSAFTPNSTSNRRSTSCGSGSIRSTSGISLSSNNAVAGPSHSNEATPPNGTVTPSIRSRSSSVSTTTTISKRKRSFPYGHEQLSSLSSLNRDGQPSSIDGTDQSSIASRPLLAGAPNQVQERNSGMHSTSSSTSDPPIERELCRYSSLRKVSNILYPSDPRTTSLETIEEDRVGLNGKGKGKQDGRDGTSKHGKPTVMSVAGGMIAIGTQIGWAMVFDYRSQELKCICGTQTIASEGGAVTALSISADHTFLGVGHATGHVALYDLSRPSVPNRHVPPHPTSAVATGRREGHLVNSKILHIGFVGTRHTAIVTADENGLSFCHTLGKILGVSSNDTLRIFGKYRLDDTSASGKENKVILGMSPLPLGPTPHLSDQNNFVAILAKEKLLVVGLKPQPRTWYKKIVKRSQLKPTRIAENETSTPPSVNGISSSSSTMSVAGALAWYPASHSDSSTSRSSTTNSDGSIDPVLAFSLGSSLMFLKFSLKRIELPSSPSNSSNPSTREEVEIVEDSNDYSFEFPIRALQWLDHELLLVLTSHSLELFDLRKRKCLERQGLSPYLETILSHHWFDKKGEKHPSEQPAEPPDSGMAAAGSMRIHKGKAFFLTSNEIVVGAVLSWADRILQFVSKGDFLSAIALATSYYEGQALGSMVGLPEDRDAQREIVGAKLRELMTASAQYAFSEDRLRDGTHVTPDGRGVDRTSLFEGLARVCAEACIALGDLMILFEELFDRYEENGIEGIFVEQMEEFIVSGSIHTLPTPIVQRLLSYRVAHEEYDLAERIIWHVDPMCLDLDQALSICLNHRLYAALIYVYNRAIGDYVAPLVDLMELLKRVLARRASNQPGSQDSQDELEGEEADVYTIFSYLSVVLAGFSYPSQLALSEEDGIKAKSSLYSFLFSGRCVVWPEGSGGKLVLSVHETLTEPTHPYLRLLLRFDSEALLDALDVAFEDPFLDDDVPGKRITRQTIINILLEVTAQDQDPNIDSQSLVRGDDATFSHIFVARNAPKYPQFIKLSKTQVQRLLVSLAQDENESTREDRQLACECLLSTYRPDHTDELLEMFERAQFYRILQSAYRAARKWSKLVSMFLDDPDAGGEILTQLAEILSKASKERRSETDSQTGEKKTKTGADDLLPLLFASFSHLISLDVGQTAALIDKFFSGKHTQALEHLESSPHQQLVYLKCFLGNGFEDEAEGYGSSNSLAFTGKPLIASHLPAALRNQYVLLLCRFETTSVVKNLEARETGFFDLELVAETCETEGAYDAVLWALDQQGKPVQVFAALDRTMSACALELLGIPREGAVALDEETREESDALALQRLRSLTEMAVKISTHGSKGSFEKRKGGLETSEMWYRLLRSLINLVQGVASSSPEFVLHGVEGSAPTALSSCRELVQDTLSTLVSSTSAESVSYPLLFKRLIGDGDEEMNRASAPSSGNDAQKAKAQLHYAEIRAVLEGMLGAYRLRTELLQITNRLFDRDLFTEMAALTRRRKRGWRPVSGRAACSGCSLVVIGPDCHSNATSHPKSQEQDENEDDTDTDKRSLARRRRRSNRSGTDTSISSIAEDAAARLASAPRYPSPYHSPLPSPRPDKGKGKSREYSSFSQAAEGAIVPLDFFTSTPPTPRSSQFGLGTGPDGGEISPSSPRRGSTPEMRKSRANSLVADTIRRASVSGNSLPPSNSSDSLFSISQEFSREVEEADENEVDQPDAILIFGNGTVWHKSCLEESKREEEQRRKEVEQEKEREESKAKRK